MTENNVQNRGKGLGQYVATYSAPVALLVIVVLGTAVRFNHLNDQSVWYDEVVSIRHLAEPTLVQFLTTERLKDPAMVPVYFVMQYYWAKMFGPSPEAVRALSIVISLVGMAFIYLLGKEAAGRLAGLIAAFCLALNLQHIYYAQEIRMYALQITLAIVSTYAFTKALSTRKTRWWLFNIAANYLLMWTHLFSIFLLFVECAFLCYWAARQKTYRHILAWPAAHLPLAASLAWWVSTMDPKRVNIATGWKATIGHSFSGLLYDAKCNIGAVFHERFTASGSLLLILYGLALVVVLASLLTSKRSKATSSAKPVIEDQKREQPLLTALLLAIVVIPPVSAFLISRYVFSFYASRYFVFTSFGYYVLMGIAVAKLRYPSLKVVVTLALVAIHAHLYWDYPTDQWRQDWRKVGRLIAQTSSANDPLYVCPAYNTCPAVYNTVLPETQIHKLFKLTEQSAYLLQKCTRGDSGLWFVLSWPVTAHQLDLFETDLRDNNLRFSRHEFGDRATRTTLYHVSPLKTPNSSAAEQVLN